MREETAVKTQQPISPAATGLLQRKCACGQHTTDQHGQCTECKKKGQLLQRRAVNQNGPTVAPPIVHEVLRSSGRPLDLATRAFMEPRFGHDFSQVRVHTDARAAKSAQAINALAYTVGQNVVFGTGQYAPATMNGNRVLAHELTHVVQQKGQSVQPKLTVDTDHNNSLESEAQQVERVVGESLQNLKPYISSGSSKTNRIQRRVMPENVSCRNTGLRNPDLSGPEVVAAIQAADSEAIELALRAELLLDFHLLLARAGEPVDNDFDTILQEELGLTLTNPDHFPLIQQQINRFRRVRETLESGYLRYICRGGTVTLVGCETASCGDDFAFTCPGNRLIVLCQAFWDNPEQRSATILHEPFHIWFDMARHATNALRRADASCFESFALRVAGREAFASCVDHMAG
jgi:hypothetical protein